MASLLRPGLRVNPEVDALFGGKWGQNKGTEWLKLLHHSNSQTPSSALVAVPDQECSGHTLNRAKPHLRRGLSFPHT